MDFGSLLHVAQKNEKMPKREVKYYSTKFEPPKKEERSKQLSDNIKKFLARKELEEKRKALEAREKREELLALRSQDRKATGRISRMLKRTKSANKSVIQDAIDHDNTAVTLVGPSQPDEDDYGYVSQEASAFYNKMMQKYSTMPEEEKFSKAKKTVNTNLKEIKDRVRAALEREQEEALLPHKRKRKPKERENEQIEEYVEEEIKQEEKPKPKPRPAAPPPLNFNDLLKLAEKKQFEPILIEPKVESKDVERPLTKKQKKDYEKERAWREKKERGEGGSSELPKPERMGPPQNKIPKISSSVNGKIPKLSNTDDRKAQMSKPIPKKNDDRPNLSRPIPRKNDEKSRPDDRIPKRNDPPKKSELKSNNVQSQSASSDRKLMSSTELKLRAELEKYRRLYKLNGGSSSNKSPPPKSTNNSEKNKPIRRDANGKEIRKSSLNDKPKQFPPPDLKPKQIKPPTNLKPKQFPPSDLKPKQFPPQDVRRKKDARPKPPMGHKRRILDDDDSEYDSEMDDFIDDGPDGEADYSKYISEIFGYDKSKYRHVDDEVDDMESSFSQVMKEEFVSSKIGLMEDLEDMRVEAEEKKKKAIMKKKMRK